MVVSTVSHSAQEIKSRQKAVVVVAAVMLVITYVSLALRLWVRGRMIHSLGWDDAYMCVAQVAFSMNCIALFIVIANGGGTNLHDGSMLRRALAWSIVNEIFYVVTHIFMKIALAILFLRLLVIKWQRRLVYFIIVLSTILNIVSVLFIIFMCGNPRHHLDRVIQGKCASKQAQIAMGYKQAAVTMLTDWVFAILPFFLLWNAKMDRRTKISVGFILFLGTTGSVAAVARFFYLESIALVDDFFWNATHLAIWSTVELGTGITAGSLVTLRPLFKRVAYHVHKSTRTAANSLGSWGDRAVPPSIRGYSSSARARSQHGEWQRGTGNGIHRDTKFQEPAVAMQEKWHSRDNSTTAELTDTENEVQRTADQPLHDRSRSIFQKAQRRGSLRKTYLKWDGFRGDRPGKTTTTCTGKLSNVNSVDERSESRSPSRTRRKSIANLWQAKLSRDNLDDREDRSGVMSVELGHVRGESRETMWPRVGGSETPPHGLATRWVEGDSSDGDTRYPHEELYRQDAYVPGYDQRSDTQYDSGHQPHPGTSSTKLSRKNSDRLRQGGISKVVDIEVTVEDARGYPGFELTGHGAGRAL